MSGGVPAGELLPCPFCGGADGRLVQCFTRASDDFAFWSVECLDCGAEIADDESQEAADRHWNTRATPTPPIEGRDADVERLREALLGIEIYGTDTLFGNAVGPSDREWMRDGVREMRNRARAALQALGERG
ncbi:MULTISPECIES: Lar family restriction alleviation protein [unclassified Sphingomonas]|uniref:Lar family restriction alleviation protein n=1 Tax=unclassified Sphingomonas TaxID=196159 RepID=UPI0006F428D3|nr:MULTISPECIES: Lar family restriction alleviation protein [unclassified Sphingomonas]KQM58806.1 hypothetical protein ASE65_10605 [Sphingomonas sp. Leaf16]KQN11062.1 hypothetical protein ASE81_11595 [Sphingomonas sp. Leaf29]KQN18362.1 hypothetical protein ASE83_11525 [Sphingomonas sp. Leaf32]